MKTLADIRSTFLNFFESQGHTAVESSPLVPRNDPTLMFTNSGMVQFKNVFTGAEKRAYTRATTAQKCVRAGGKHNDLENVGYTARHHTFFEMLGNFSFGDYFKDDAIYFAWTLVTKYFDLSTKNLLVTVFHDDEEAIKIWKKVAGLPDSKIIRIPTSDNFWRMGDTGPCGPCSEIFIDQGDKLQGGPPGSPDEDGDRFLEFWNLVFMQYEEQAGGTRVALPRPSIDTGMGLERMAAILQGKTANYDIDLFENIIQTTADFVKVDPLGAHKPSFRVIADHLRASSFLIADGVLPSNEGRGYVLRRIMRRGMRHLHLLGAKEPMLYRLVPELVKQMGVAYPELVRAEALVAETLRLEETRFKQTLDRGIKLLDEETGRLAEGQDLAGDVAFKLYDTFGFPLDMTQDVLRGRGKKVDVAGFDAAMAKQKAAAREAWAGSGDAATEKVWFDLREENGATEFLGYATETAEGKIVALVKDGVAVAQAKAGDSVAILVNQTPFYAESGGQAGDCGEILTASGAKIVVSDTVKRLGALHVHVGSVVAGAVACGDLASLLVDHAHRADLRANHSATHLLHAALHHRFGKQVTQKGSLVSADRLRFDISHPTPLTPHDIEALEAEVNARVRENTEVMTHLMTPEEAIETGAMALFGEKYGDEVRVVSMGGDSDVAGRAYSVELCGGTHVRRTGDIGFFKIVAESAIAANVRRIEAVTGRGALAYVTARDRVVADAASLLSVQAEEVAARLSVLVAERRKFERENAELRRQLALAGGASGDSDADVREVGGVSYLARVMDGIPAKDLRGLADEFKKKIGSGVVALVATNEGKAAIVVAVTADLATRFNAVELIKSGVSVLGGQGGGGRPDMAQAGGPEAGKAREALEAIGVALAG